MELPVHCNELGKASKLGHNPPQPLMTGGVQSKVLFSTSLLLLLSSKDHIHVAASRVEPTLVLREQVMFQVYIEAVEQTE